MIRILSMCFDAAVSAVFLIPLFLYLNKHYFHDHTRMIGYILFAIYLSGVFAVVGLPDIRYVRFDFRYNIVPFAYMFSDLTNTLLNVVLFIPLGFFLPFFWERFHRFPYAVLFGFFTSMLIESLQIFTLRATDINDLITNTLGSLLGWILARIALHFTPAWTPGYRTREVYVVCCAAFAVMFFIQPFLADTLAAIYYLLNK